MDAAIAWGFTSDGEEEREEGKLLGAFTHVRACAARQPGPRRTAALAVWFRLIELARNGLARCRETE